MNSLNEFSRRPSSFHNNVAAAPLFDICSLQSIWNEKELTPGVARRLDLYEIIWVTKGNGTLSVDLGRYPVEDNSIYCLSPGQLRAFESDSLLEGYYISVAPAFLYVAENHLDFRFLSDQLLQDKTIPVIPAKGEFKYEMEDIVLKMIREIANYFEQRSEILNGLLKIFMIYLSRKFENRLNMQAGCNETVKKFITMLKTNVATKKMVADYASDLCVTPNYLNKIVKQVTGFPASHHIQQHIIFEAKRQAIYSGLNMKQVAFQLGFDSYAHFSKFFKSNSGMNFTTFKNERQYMM